MANGVDMKTEEQVTRARSVLAVTALIMEHSGDPDAQPDELGKAVANTAINVLAWVLDREGTEEFDQKIADLNVGLQAGIAMCMADKAAKG